MLAICECQSLVIARLSLRLWRRYCSIESLFNRVGRRLGTNGMALQLLGILSDTSDAASVMAGTPRATMPFGVARADSLARLTTGTSIVRYFDYCTLSDIYTDYLFVVCV
jgi:hypothetical protein